MNAGSVPLRYGLKRLVNQLHEEGIEQYIVTTSSKSSVISLLETYFKNERKYFKEFITIENVLNTKPHPEPYLLASSIVGINNENILAIEDSPAGLESATAASLACLITLPCWANRDLTTQYSKAKAIVDCLGDHEHSTQYYQGPPCTNNVVTVEYLNNLLV